jgi:formate--tetrahydrofolate ligase
MDMNDRALRSTLIGLEGGGINGVMREDGFEITAASEIMAIWGLSSDLMDLKARMGRALVGYDSLGRPVEAGELGVSGAMAALMKNAMNPNLVQTIEGVPAFVHGGPFANIAHGCNTLVATRMARKLADYTVTEAGFGADLGAEKFFHIKCRGAGMAPSAVVLVVTRRAFRVHGLENVQKHVENLSLFGVPVVICINRFLDDSDEELQEIVQTCRDLGVPAEIADYRESGGEGGLELAQRVVEACETEADFRPLYDLEAGLEEKVETLATRLYGADVVDFSAEARTQLKQITNQGYGRLPVCMAKTPASLSDDPKLAGRPRDFRISVKGARVSAGAGFVVIYTGKIMTMPGLPKKPAALDIDIDNNGTISGLF